MDKIRQNSGLIPLEPDNTHNDIVIPSTYIPYDPELYEMNQKITNLKIEAEARISRILVYARKDPSIRRKL